MQTHALFVPVVAIVVWALLIPPHALLALTAQALVPSLHPIARHVLQVSTVPLHQSILPIVLQVRTVGSLDKTNPQTARYALLVSSVMLLLLPPLLVWQEPTETLLVHNHRANAPSAFQVTTALPHLSIPLTVQVGRTMH